MLRLLTIGCALLLAACATEARYVEILNTYVGKPESRLIQRWGPPHRAYESGGARYLAYDERDSMVLPGVAPSYQTTVVGGTAYSTPVGGSPPMAVSLRCETVFTVKDGTIVSWSYQGNNCVSF